MIEPKQITAHEAKRLAVANQKETDLYLRLFIEIKEQALLGETSFQFEPVDELFTQRELDRIRGLGYEITKLEEETFYTVSWD